MKGVVGFTSLIPGTVGWITDSAGCSVPTSSSSTGYFSKNPNSCTFNQPLDWAKELYVPIGSRWFLYTNLCFNAEQPCTHHSNTVEMPSVNGFAFRLDRSIGAQNPDFGGPAQHGNYALAMTICYHVGGYSGNPETEPWCSDETRLPDHPSIDTCSVNQDNPISVDLGEIDRADLSVTPGNGVIKHVSIPVYCYNEAGSATMPVNLQMSYTASASTLAGGFAVKTSLNGVGVQISYNSIIITPDMTLPLMLPMGNSNLDFTFETLRDTAVAMNDIPTGEFTASAVMKLSLP